MAKKPTSNIEVIETCYNTLCEMQKSAKAWADDKSIIELYNIISNSINAEIHGNLMAFKSPENETIIRNLIRRYVIGCKDKGRNWFGAIPLIENKVVLHTAKREKDKDLIAQYLSLHDDFMALASFRSFKHFCLFMEQDWDKKVWKPQQENFEGWFFYANQMVLDKKVQFIEKQMPTGRGKCKVATTKVLTPNGIKTLADIKVGDSIYSMKDNHLVIETVTNKWETRKSQIKVETRGGLSVIASPEHKLYTQRGYVKANELTCKDFLYRLCKPIDGNSPINDDELTFITGMLFDGCCRQNKNFTKNKSEILDAFLKSCDNLGFTYLAKPDKNRNQNTVEVKLHKNNGNVAKLLGIYGIDGCLSKEKRLPLKFFDMPLSQKYKFIGIMFATDGYIPRYKNSSSGTAGITSASKGLVEDIQQLLNTCGIYSAISYKNAKNQYGEFDAWTLTIPNEYLYEIYNNCYCYDKQSVLKHKIDCFNAVKTKPYCINTNYPKEVVEDCKEFRKLVHKQYYRNNSFKRYIVEDFNSKTGLLENVVYKDFVWEQIKSIEANNTIVDMVDIEVSNTHNFIANGIVSHNSLSDCFLIAWIFGQNINADVIKIFGNKYNCVRAFDTIVTLMSDRKYAKVFPYYQQFNCKAESLFEIRKQKDGEFKLTGSQKPTNFLTVGKESKISGTRAMYMFLDDITQAEDASSIRMHDKDISTYLEVWARRKHSNNNFFIVIGGTTYSIYDILSWIKNRFNGDNAVPDKRFKWTSVAKSNRIIANGTSVFICIPALDYVTDLSTYEAEYPTEQLRKMREDDYETFMAMEQQQPQKPKDNPFYITQLQEYTDLPKIGEHGRTDSCWAYLDGKRKGADYCAMPIFTPIEDRHFLVDAFYDNRPMKECYAGLVSKIKQHHITKLIIENNINEGLKVLLEKLLFEQGLTFCKIEEIFSTSKKDVRIANAEADIKANIIFPKFGIYARSSPIGMAMDELYGYSYTKKVEHDDFTDAIAGYTESFISKNKRQYASIAIFRR